MRLKLIADMLTFCLAAMIVGIRAAYFLAKSDDPIADSAVIEMAKHSITYLAAASVFNQTSANFSQQETVIYGLLLVANITHLDFKRRITIFALKVLDHRKTTRKKDKEK